jgi:hypothetical protein
MTAYSSLDVNAEAPFGPPAKGETMITRLETKECPHEHRRMIGIDETAYFYQCDDCHETLAETGGQLWRVRPALIPS